VNPLRLKKFSFTAFLPLVEPAIWSVLILLPAFQGLMMYSRFDGLIAPSGGSVRSKVFEVSLTLACERRFTTILNLNLPGALLGAPISLPAISYFRTHPGFFSAKTWHALTLPFFCLPAWWLVGRGLDAILSRTRIPLAYRILGLILSCACIAFAIAIVTSGPEDKPDLLPIMPGAVFWAVAFSVLPLTWLLPVDSQAPV
jgi:hypothetical protein